MESPKSSGASFTIPLNIVVENNKHCVKNQRGSFTFSNKMEKKMNKTILILMFFVCGIFNLHADEEVNECVPCENVSDSFGYFTFDFGVPALFGTDVGFRAQFHHHGIDVGVGVVPLVVVYDAHAFANYLYYPTPCLSSQFYMGVGVRGGVANSIDRDWVKYKGYVAPGIILGKSHMTGSGDPQFVQIAVYPGIYADNRIRFAPAINISYGFSF